ncbi:MAG: hypothetical protein WAX77_12820 [Methylococcaceae bacterium]
MIKQTINLLVLLFLITIHTKAQANSLSLSCEILNAEHLAQSSFSANETAIFKIHAAVDNNQKDYHIDFKIAAKVNMNGFKIPLQLSQNFTVPVRNAKNPLSITEERIVKLPPLRGELALTIHAALANSQTDNAVCENSLTIK